MQKGMNQIDLICALAADWWILALDESELFILRTRYTMNQSDSFCSKWINLIHSLAHQMNYFDSFQTINQSEVSAWIKVIQFLAKTVVH